MLADSGDVSACGAFSPYEPDRFGWLAEALLDYDPFMVADDFGSYWKTRRSIDILWKQPEAWWRASISSAARMGWFSSDRAVREYAEEIWDVARRVGNGDRQD